MTRPQVSVILSVYNHDQFIKQAVKSILSQSFKNFEFIIVNDASTDKTKQVLNKIKDKRVKIITNKTKLGLARSLNIAFKRSKGQYIARMDADDIAHPNKLDKQVKYLKKHSNIAMCGSAVNLIDLNNNKIGTKSFPSTYKKIKNNIMRLNLFVHPTVMFRRNVINFMPYDPKLNGAEDYDLWLRIAIKHQVINLDDKLLDYRINPRGISFASYKHTQLQAIKARLKAINQYYYPKYQLIYLVKPLISLLIPSKIKKYFFLKSFSIISPTRYAALKALSKVLRPTPNRKFQILDIGCGSNATYLFLKTLKYKGSYLGIDLKFKNSPQNVSNSSLNAKFIETNLFKLTTSKKYDLIFSLWNLEHIKNDLRALKKIKSLLKKNGKAIILVPSFWTFPVEFGSHGYHYYSARLLKTRTKQSQLSIVSLQPIGGIFSLIFSIVYQWLAYLVLVPSLVLLKILGRLPLRQTRRDVGSASLSRKILSSSIYSYQKTKIGRFIHLGLMKMIYHLDKLFHLTPTNYLIILKR